MSDQGPAGGGPRALAVIAGTSADMQAVGAAVAAVLRAGDTVLLGGDLGAGKTTLTKGLATALGVAGPVTSPTFVLVHSYPTQRGFDLLHADVWRLEQLQEVVDLAIPEQVEDGAAAVVEWGERAAPALDQDCLHIAIDFVALLGPDQTGDATTDAQAHDAQAGAGSSRLVVLSPSGPAWEPRMEGLGSALAGAGLVVQPWAWPPCGDRTAAEGARSPGVTWAAGAGEL